MNDPIRIRESGSDAPDELRELFRSAKGPEPLTAPVEAALSTRVAGISSARSAALAKALPYLVSAALAGGGLVAWRATTQRSAHPASVAIAPSSTSSSLPAVAPAPSASSVGVASPESVVAPSDASARLRVRAQSSAAPAKSADEDSLSGESRLLNQAHRALTTDPARALAIAREHAKRYPHGQLAAERELIMVQALVKLGRTREAEARGQELRKTAPKSIYEERLDKVLR
ncbi:MAG TPA: hypothetical protein VFQ35_16465 [Polyangiaceae bacterium]|nr:hypothetical protein [Polyangiaceae bacterium]